MKINQLIASLESAPVGDGDLLGKPFKALPYQRRFVRSVFDEGTYGNGPICNTCCVELEFLPAVDVADKSAFQARNRETEAPIPHAA